jgi:hypothetical protein
MTDLRVERLARILVDYSIEVKEKETARDSKNIFQLCR